MTYLSLIEKLQILFNMFLNYKVVGIFTGLLIIFTILYWIKKINVKKYSVLVIISLVLMFVISIISNYKILSDTFDNFATIFFSNIYFPSIYVYIGMLVVTFIVFVVSILNKKLHKVYRIINSVMLIINNVLLAIILNEISKGKTDIFSTTSLYSNTNLVAILELNMNIFILWIFSLIVVYTTLCICERIEAKKKVSVSNEIPAIEENITIPEPIATLEIPEVVMASEIVTEEENTIIEEPTPVVENSEVVIESEIIPSEPVIEVVEPEEPKVTLEDILNGKLPVTYCETKVNDTINNVIVNPQEIYEEKYQTLLQENETKEEIVLQDVISELPLEENIIIETTSLEENKEDIIIETTSVEEDTILVEEPEEDIRRTLINERLKNNSISLNELSKEIEKEESPLEVIEKEVEEVSISKIEDEESASVIVDTKEDKNSNYTIEEYKKFIKMLKQLKIHTKSDNVKIDDAIAISLISNYSYEDCIKFKDLLESNLR